MKEHDILIWKYLDGTAGTDERATVKHLLETDPAFKAAFLERRQLAKTMEEEELEQPSMRFAKTIMEKLPDLYHRAIEPLVRPLWIRLFIGALSLLLLAYSGLVVHGLRTGQVSEEGPIAQITGQFTRWLEGVPPQVLTVVSALCLAYLGLVWLDQFLKRQVLSRGKEG